MSVDYDIAFYGRKPIKIKGHTCFSALSSLKGHIKWDKSIRPDLVIDKDPKNEKRTRVRKVIYYLDIDKMVTKPESSIFIMYMLKHPVWSKYILNKSIQSIMKYGVHVTAEIRSEHLLMILTGFRYLNEFPLIVKAFFTYRRGYPDINKDLAFCLSHMFYVKDREINVTDGLGKNHTMFTDYYLTDKDIVRFSSEFPYEDKENLLYNDKLLVFGISAYLHKMGKGLTLHDFKKNMVALYKKQRIDFHQELYRLSSEVDKANDKKESRQ